MLAVLALMGIVLISSLRTFAENRSDAMLQPDILDVEIGEPFSGTMARSTRKYDFKILLDMQGLELWPGGEDGSPLQIVLRNGAGQSVALPYQPDSGMLWMYVGVTDELDLDFHTFIRMDPGDGSATQQGEDDIEAISRIYASIMELTLRARDQSSCFHNSIEISEKPCERVILATEKLSPDALREELHRFRTLVSTEEWDRKLPARVLNLGQWWLPNGALAMMTVTASSGGGEDIPGDLSLRVNIKDFVNSYFGRQLLECYDQQAIFPEKMLYSQAQAAHVFHGLYADYFPPVVDGEQVTDPIRRAELDWGQIFYNYWQDKENLSLFCEKLHLLEREAGYEGPFAPPR
ncbi:hypothetical protein JJJ17_12280 [Paracoccus caeni]|uniref:Uncharacterized protein n=1 Tax=Paracoccus caeni TaxID=657651 RepID=A0A934W098_9RHOB|nr:hypothetical protein [Paracoccus caeni]MBK4216705.1 hypothetical protein [Paracoccus caeni]